MGSATIEMAIMKSLFVTYRIDLCLNPMERKHFKTWIPWYIQLSEEDMLWMAFILGFKKSRALKLINHKSKKFCYIWKKDYEIIKHFHDEPIDTIPYRDLRQPFNIKSAEDSLAYNKWIEDNQKLE